MRSPWLVLLAGIAILPAMLIQSGRAQQKGKTPLAAKDVTKDNPADWPMYHRDFGGTGYSPLTQITTQNVAGLTSAWTYRLQSDAPPAAAAKGKAKGGGAVNSEATPIVVNGVMYLPGAGRVVALDPETGKEIWEYPVTGGAPSRRGVAYWPGDGSNPPRIVFTAGRRLIALNANTGKIDPGFGKEGEVDMVVPYNSVPLVYRNVLVVGANSTNGPVSIGNPRAFDARTGAKVWEFSAVAQPGEVGHDTWEGDSWKDRSGANAWPFYFTVDDQRGLVYLPLASPIPGFYGGSVRKLRGCSGCSDRHTKSGISRPSITISGITIRPRLRDCSTSSRTTGLFPRWRSLRNPATCIFSIARPVSRSSACWNGGCRGPTCPENWRLPRSPFL